MSCPHCDRPTTAIDLRPGGRRVVMRSCLPCELTHWELNGFETPVDRVLDLVSEARSTFMRANRVAV